MQLEDLPATAEPVDGKGRRSSRDEHKVQLCRSVPAKRLQEANRASSLPELVGVVDDEHEMLMQVTLERSHQSRGDRLCPCALFYVRTEGMGERGMEIELGQAATERVDETREEPVEHGVRRIRRVPGSSMRLCPRGHKRRLPEPWTADDCGQPHVHNRIEAFLKLPSREQVTRQRRRCELDCERLGTQSPEPCW